MPELMIVYERQNMIVNVRRRRMNTKKNLSHCIKIRPITIEDYETVLKWSKDDAFCTANGWDINRNPKELYRWWLNCVNLESDDFIRMGIEFKEKLIGYADLACMKDNSTEIGIAIGESKLWGKGIGSNSVMLMMEYASREFEITTFKAETHEENIRSRKMLEKIGFKEVSRFGSEEYLGMTSQLIQYCLKF